MDDSDTTSYKWWEHVDRKETFDDILNRVWKGGDFASDEERILESMHIISYLFNVLDSDTSTNEQDVWAAVEAISKILQHSPVYQDWMEKVYSKATIPSYMHNDEDDDEDDD